MYDETCLLHSNGCSFYTTKDSFSGEDEAIPVLDSSKLVFSDPGLWSLAVQDLGRACIDYGCFIVTNHGIPDTVIKGIIDKIFEFFDLPEDDKRKWSKGNINHVSREFVKMAVHPTFHCPSNPPELGIELLGKISTALDIEKKMNLKSGYNFFTVLTNGKYKSALHRVVVNNEVRRATLPLLLGPSLDTVVSPAPEFTGDGRPPAYLGITYKQYLEYNNFHFIDVKSCLNQIRL
ncbi:hypothetical protein P3X46_034591 [Hevea brasiliensis]|uniref:Non-haem dioxygenase N-terminal domain-containing protein n=1 Tax=Hevea brasiliensis TaxID=3981 RepID=A0ABQ9KAM2_HEVBR|nr:hypothetical protein P3X46_034591 [Hevea brasiliensis]